MPPEEFPVAPAQQQAMNRRPPPSIPNGHHQSQGAPSRALPPTPQDESDGSDYEGM